MFKSYKQASTWAEQKLLLRSSSGLSAEAPWTGAAALRTAPMSARLRQPRSASTCVCTVSSCWSNVTYCTLHPCNKNWAALHTMLSCMSLKQDTYVMGGALSRLCCL